MAGPMYTALHGGVNEQAQMAGLHASGLRLSTALASFLWLPMPVYPGKCHLVSCSVPLTNGLASDTGSESVHLYILTFNSQVPMWEPRTWCQGTGFTGG